MACKQRVDDGTCGWCGEPEGQCEKPRECAKELARIEREQDYAEERAELDRKYGVFNPWDR